MPSARASDSASLHQQLRDAALACGAVDEELRDLAAVRLVRRQREDHLNGADQLAVGERSEQQPAALLDLGGKGLRMRSRASLVGERRHVADRRASGDAVDEDGCEPVELCVRFGCIKTPDLDLLGHRVRIDTEPATSVTLIS